VGTYKDRQLITDPSTSLGPPFDASTRGVDCPATFRWFDMSER
jgi:hypothetical protein